jgi:hypothetical protein
MKLHFRSRDSWVVRWQQRGVELLRHALLHLQRFLAVNRQTEALTLIPIRAMQPHLARPPRQRT